MANDGWETPEWVIEHARAMFGTFALDVAAEAKNTKAGKFYTDRPTHETDTINGLVQPWHMKWWCNPPYSNIGPWVEKATTAEVPGLMLLPCDSSTQWWQKWVHGEAIVVPIGRRIRFVGAPGSPTFHSVFALYGWRMRRST